MSSLRKSRIEGGGLYKRYLLILVATVIAVVLLWPDDEEPSDQEEAPPVSHGRKPVLKGRAEWQFRRPPEQPAQQQPAYPDYPSRAERQPPPAYPYAGGGTDPYSTPERQSGSYDSYGYPPQYPVQQPGGYDSYGYPPQGRTPGYGPAPQPPQYPGSGPAPGTPYGYANPPAYQFRPLEKKETKPRYRGDYPQTDPGYPGAPFPSYGRQR